VNTFGQQFLTLPEIPAKLRMSIPEARIMLPTLAGMGVCFRGKAPNLQTLDDSPSLIIIINTTLPMFSTGNTFKSKLKIF
jgi:hypothetical protein